jgi:hypothetical protein
MSLFQNSLGFLPPYFGSGLGQRNFGFVKSAVAAANTYIVATGGTVIQSGDYKVHIFSATDNFIVTQLASNPTNNLLKVNVVAGGGGGASYAGGGGGAGGFIENLAYSLSSGATTYSCVVGSGGSGTSVSDPHGVNGNDSIFDLLQSFGGGGGGSGSTLNHNGQNGGSGGGAAWSSGIGGNGTLLQGKNGGSSIANSGGCGGGGSSTNGANSTPIYNGSNGGAGSLSSITGVYYAGGGGGAGDVGKLYGVGGIGGGGNGDNSGGSGGVNGTVNTGGGGGGDWYGNLGGNGGSGIIVISYYSPISLLTSFVDWYNQVLSNGGSLTTSEQTYINSFFYNLGTDFTEFDRLWIHGVSNAIAARTSLANPTSTIITNVNSVLFTANQGFTGNGTTSYLNSNFVPAVNGVKYQRNSANIFVYSLSNTNAGGVEGEIGNYSGPNYSYIVCKGTGLAFFALNSNNDSTISVADSLSLYQSIRTGSNTYLNYKRDTLLSTISQPSQALLNQSYFILARNGNGTPTSFSNRKLAASGMGSSSINQANFYNALQTLGTSLGWAV